MVDDGLKGTRGMAEMRLVLSPEAGLNQLGAGIQIRELDGPYLRLSGQPTVPSATVLVSSG